MVPSDADLPKPAAGLPETTPALVRPPRAAGADPGFALGQDWRGEGRGLPPALASGPDTSALLKGLRRRWLLAFGLGTVIAAAAAAAAWFLLAGNATAFALLKLSAIPQSLLNNANTPEGREGFATYQRTQAAEVKSRFVLSAALKQEEVKNLRSVTRQADPVAWLEEELKVEYQDGSELLTVSMTGPNPQEVLTLVNAVTRAYQKEVVDAEQERRQKNADELEKLYGDESAKLSTKKEHLQQMADDLGTSESGALVQKQLNLLTSLREVRSQYQQSRNERMKAQARLQAHKAQEGLLKDPPLTEETMAAALEADPIAKQYLTRMARLRDIIDEYEQNAVRPNESTRLLAEAKLASYQKKLAARREVLRTSLVDVQREKARGEYAAILAQLEKEVEPLAQQEKALKAEVETLNSEADKIGRSSTTFELLKREIKQEEQFADNVHSQAQVARVQLRSAPRVTLFQEAGLQKKDSKRQLLATLMAAVLAFGGAAFGVAWLECRARRIHTPEEVTSGLGLRVVGSVPPLPRGQADADAEDASGHSLLESIDGIRTILLRDASVAGLRVVMVTSAVSGEGKTTLASQLASSLARAGRRTLLLDCDLRRPAAHQLFEVPPQPGLSEVILGELPAAEAVRATEVDGLWMLPAGQWDREVLHALARDGVQKIFKKLRQEYDFVLVDSHPVLLATDSLLIGLHVDAVILSLLRDVSQLPPVYTACQRLANLGIRVLGAVVNGMPEEILYGGAYRPDVAQPAR